MYVKDDDFFCVEPPVSRIHIDQLVCDPHDLAAQASCAISYIKLYK